MKQSVLLPSLKKSIAIGFIAQPADGFRKKLQQNVPGKQGGEGTTDSFCFVEDTDIGMYFPAVVAEKINWSWVGKPDRCIFQDLI